MTYTSEEAPLLPGLKPVLELLTSEPQRVDLVYCKKGLRSPDVLAVQQLCRKHNIRFSLLDAPALDRLCRSPQHAREAVSHQGVIARLAVTSFCSLEELFSSLP